MKQQVSRLSAAVAARRSAQRGVTLIESLTAVAIGAIVLSAAAPGLRATIERRHLDGIAAQIAADLQLARTEAVARNQPVRVSFHDDAAGSCYLIHTGTRAQCSCAAGRPACADGATLIRGQAVGVERHVAVTASVRSMLFDPLHGTATPSGRVQAMAGSGLAVQHVVNVLGRVRSCSPAGAVPGWPAC